MSEDIVLCDLDLSAGKFRDPDWGTSVIHARRKVKAHTFSVRSPERIF